MLQMSVVFNCNYQPYLQGANMQKKRELMAELSAVLPVPPADFEQLLDALALDERSAPVTSHGAGARAYEQHGLRNPNCRRKGPYVRQSAWYSIIAAIQHYDAGFQALRWLLREIAKRLLKLGADVKALKMEAVGTFLEKTAGDGTQSKQEHQEQMAQLRKTKGNQLVLSPIFMHNLNFFNCRVMLLVAGHLWSEQTLWSVDKTTAQQSAEFAVGRAANKGEIFLRQMWKDSTFSAVEWGRLGASPVPGMVTVDMAPAVDPLTGWTSPGVLEAEIPRRVAHFFFAIVEARWWTLAHDAFSFPGSFAATLSSQAEERDAGCRHACECWDAATLAEVAAKENPGLKELREKAYFLDWPINQYGFRLLAHHEFRAVPQVQNWFEREFVRIGDSKLIEESNKIARSVEQHDQDPQHAPGLRIYHALTRQETLLSWRGLNHVEVSKDFYFQPKSKPGKAVLPWRQMFNPMSTPPKAEWYLDDVPKTRDSPFESKSTH